MIKKGLILLSSLVCLLAFSAHAQVQSDDIALQINPEYPKANEQVVATLSSFSTDLNKAQISWFLNGQLSIENVGQKNFSFTSGDVGASQMVIEAQIITQDGSLIDKQATINQTGIDMLWEAVDAYAPPFYEGKTLAPSEGTIKVVAMPNSSNLGGLSYSWSQDGNNQVDSSGYGKNFYIYKNSYLEPDNTIQATVSNLLGNNIGQEKITIKPGSPQIIFYRKDSTLGTQWEKALTDGYAINSNGETLVAEPYFFSPGDLNSSDLTFSWKIGDSPINTPNPDNEISIKPTNGQSGQSTIELSISNVKSLFMSLDKTLNVNF